MASKDLTFNLFGRDVSASRAFREIAREADRASKSVDSSFARVATTADKVDRKVGALATSIIAIGPALVPLAGVAVGALAGLVGTAGTAVVAIMGINDEIKNGTDLGQEYKHGLNELGAQFKELKHTAAVGVLDGFNDGIKAMRPLWPELNRDVAGFSSQLGQITGNTAPGLVRLFSELDPLFNDIGNDLVRGSAGFKTWATSSDSVARFVAWAQVEIPRVTEDLKEIAAAAVHVAVGFGPLGSGTLTTLKLLAQAINAIPIGVLQTAVPIISTTVLALKGFSTLSNASKGLESMSLRMSALNASSRSAAAVGFASTAVRGLGLASLVAGPAIGILSAQMSANQKKAIDAQMATNDYTEALKASTGAIDANVRSSVAKTLTDNGMLDAARKLGISQKVLTDAVLGSKPAVDALNAALAPYAANLTQINVNGNTWKQTTKEQSAALDTLQSGFATQSNALKEAIQNQRDYAAATSTSTEAQKGYRLSSDQATASMQKENDAAGLLKASFDKLNGKTLSAADAQNAFDSALVNMGDHIDKTGKKVKFTTTSINDMSSASVALRGQLNGQVHNLEAVIEANGDLKGSTAAAQAQYKAMRQQIIDNAVAHGISKDAVTAYIDKLLKIPPRVATEADLKKEVAEARIAQFKKELGSIPGQKTIVLHADATGAISSIQTAVTKINGVLSTVRITTSVNGTTHMTSQSGSGGPYGGSGGNASGTSFFDGGDTLINEQGSERVTLPRGSVIDTASRTKFLEQQSGPGGDITVNLVVDGQVLATTKVRADRLQGKKPHEL